MLAIHNFITTFVIASTFLFGLGFVMSPLPAEAQTGSVNEQELRTELMSRITALLSTVSSSITPPVLTRTLSLGSQGEDVSDLQRFLTKTGDYTYGEVTGYFGAATEAAVQRYQARNNILSSGTPDTTGYGAVGPNTRTHIMANQSGAVLSHIGMVNGVSDDNLFGDDDNTVPPPSAKGTSTVAVSGPVTVAATNKIPCSAGTTTCVTAGRRIDAQYPTLSQGSNRYWFVVNSGHMWKMRGSLSDLFTSVVWSKKTADVFGEKEVTDPAAVRDKKWIVNTYETGTAGEVLGFVHIEREDASPGADGWGRVGLARSTNYGDTFKYLGHIAIPFNDPEHINVSGVPYFVKDGYFYAYYLDRCYPVGGKGVRPNVAVIRAKVSDVVAAARKGEVSLWKKYYDGGWTESSIGGKCTELWQAKDGIIHSDAVYSTHTNKAYMVRQRTKNESTGQSAWLSLFESTDGIKWTLTKEIVPPTMNVEFGYAYQVLLGEKGENKGVVGSRFYIYSDKDAAAGPMKLEHGSIVRWLVDLDPSTTPPQPSVTHTFSKEFSSTQGKNNWRYQYYVGGQHTDMTWDTTNNRWKGDETFTLISKGQFHPGSKSNASLTWTAPKNGVIKITGNAKDLNKVANCGDGAAAAIHKNSTSAWYAEIANGDYSGVNPNKTLNVVAGDQIHFIVTRGTASSNNQCDTVGWDPTITYQ